MPVASNLPVPAGSSGAGEELALGELDGEALFDLGAPVHPEALGELGAGPRPRGAA